MCSPYGNPGRNRLARDSRQVDWLAGGRNPQFDFADGSQVFIQLALVIHPEPGPQTLGVFSDEIEHALLIALAAGPRFGGFAGTPVGEEPLIHRPGVVLFHQWLRG